MPRTAASAPAAPGVDAELKALLRRVKLGRMHDTLPERLALACTESLPHADFLSLLRSDEVERRDRSSAQLRARAARLDPGMRIDTFSSDTGVVFDRELWNELRSHAPSTTPAAPWSSARSSSGKHTGHRTRPRRYPPRRSVLFTRVDQLFRHLKAARLDNGVEAEMRRLIRIELLTIDDFALQSMGPIETADFYELVVERHQKTATILTSNRDPSNGSR